MRTCSLPLVAIAFAGLIGCNAPEERRPFDRTAAADSTRPPAAPSVPDTSRAPLPTLPGILAVTPVDDAQGDSALTATRDSLLAIARRGDTTAFAADLDPAVKYSFGVSNGRRGFFAHWQRNESLDALWRTVEDVLTYGGRRLSPTSFTAPWTFSALPDSLDAFEHLIVRDSAVPVRLVPGDTAAPIGTLSYTVVRAEGGPDSLWRAIRLTDGRVGYVDAARIRSPVDYRLGLVRTNGRWKIQYFVAGD